MDMRFEARIYAEDPNNDFLPTTGKIAYMGLPNLNDHVRVDSGIISGDTVSVYYDPMIAKLIVWDRDRNAALARLRGALADLHVAGLTTNIEFLHCLASNDSFIQADLDTHFLDKHSEELLIDDQVIGHELLVTAALHVMLKQANQATSSSIDTYSPWNESTGWRLNEDNYHNIELVHNNRTHNVVAHFREQHEENSFLFEIENKEYPAKGYLEENKLYINLNGHQSVISLSDSENKLVLFKNAISWEIEVKDNSLVALEQESQANLTAPMPGTVIDVLVDVGDIVEEGQALIVMEAMKMEHTIKAHKAMVVSEVLYKVGDLVDDGAELITFEDND